MFAETKINELQKKVAGLLQVVKELIKLLHKSNISFPSSLSVDDIASFKEELLKCKRKSIIDSNDATKKSELNFKNNRRFRESVCN